MVQPMQTVKRESHMVGAVWTGLAPCILWFGCGGAAQTTPPPPPPPSEPKVVVESPPTPAPTELTSDEGMWLLNDFPSARLERRHGFAPSHAWLDEVRLSSVRLAGGCSGSFVSPNGLVMTNHHCAVRCVQQVSTKQKDFMTLGFNATSAGEELRCPEMEINQLVEITDVTDRVGSATKGLEEKAANEARKAELSRIEKSCATSDDYRCDVVSLFHGGKYHLYKYRRYQDVRLVFAPEKSIAFFGGDPDNFNFPRYDLDVTFVRVYQDGKPSKTEHYFPWSAKGAEKGELVFVSGHPGSTSRTMTVAQLAYMRDYALPSWLIKLAERRGAIREFQKLGAEQKRVSETAMFGSENAIKALRGRRLALVDAEFFERKVREEQELRARVNADPELRAKYGDAWERIAAAQERKRELRTPLMLIEKGDGFWSTFMDHARTIVRASEELPKPNEQRYREFVDSQLPALKQQLYSSAPINDEFETMKLALSLTRLRELLGTDHSVVKAVLGTKSPQQVAEEVVRGTKLGKVDERKRLFEGGKAAVQGSKDPAIDLARTLEPFARDVRKSFEDEVEAVEDRNAERIAAARFAVLGTSVYPDATFSLRLSFGTVQGWEEGGKQVEPFTTMGGAFDRHTGADPYALPKSWLEAKNRINLSTPFNLSTSNDIIGGNSGSPMFNKDREIVGLIFDGNIHSLGGDYAFDDRLNRAVAVHSAAILEALGSVYDAKRVKEEIEAARK